MKKKIVIGSILATVVVILTTFTSAVGTQSIDLSNKNISPLYNLRTQKAISKEDKNIDTSTYIGKGEPFTINFQKLSYTMLQFEKIIDKIREMNDEQFDRLVNDFVNELNKENDIAGRETVEIVNALYTLRENSAVINPDCVGTPNAIDTIGNPTQGCILRLLFILFFPGAKLALLGIFLVVGSTFLLQRILTIHPDYC